MPDIFTYYMAQYKRCADNAAFYARWANLHRVAGRLRHSIAYQDMAARAARDAAHAAGMIMYMSEAIGFTSRYRQMKGLHAGGYVSPNFNQFKNLMQDTHDEVVRVYSGKRPTQIVVDDPYKHDDDCGILTNKDALCTCFNRR